MPRRIGSVEIPSFQAISISTSEDTSEVDLISEDSNILFNGPKEAEEITIEFTLEEQSVETSLQEQKQEVRSLPETPQEENDFSENGYKGYISVEDVSFPESSSESNIIQGEITGNFLPWPKHFPDNPPAFVIEVGGDVEGNLNMGGDILIFVTLESSSEYTASISGSLNSISSISGDMDGVLDSTASVDILRAVIGDLSSNLSLSGDLEVVSGEYSTGTYGDGTYNE